MLDRGCLSPIVALFTAVLTVAGFSDQCLGRQTDRTPRAGAEVNLRPKFTKGQITRYEMKIDTQSQLTSKELPEIDQKQLMQQHLQLSLRVLETGDEGTTIELVYDSAKISFENEEFQAEFDSTKQTKAKPAANTPTDPPDMADPSKLLESLVKGMVGSKMTLTIDPAGNITSISGDGGVSGMSKSFMAATGSGALQSLGGGLPSGLDTAKWIINGPRASGTARIGESWTNDDSLSGTPLSEFRMKTTHTLLTHRNGKAGLKFSGKAEAGSAAATSPSGFQLQHMTNDGTYDWDTERGQLLKMNADMRVVIEAMLTGVLMKHESVMTVSVRKLER